ncbi:MAG: hypothetical protein RL208_726 [Pseudomonadota bacterium]|jgi:type IV secretory pathway VirB2 component (pilin)
MRTLKIVFLTLFIFLNFQTFSFAAKVGGITTADCTSKNCADGQTCVAVQSAYDGTIKGSTTTSPNYTEKSVCISNDSSITPCGADSDCSGIIGADRCLSSPTSATLFASNGTNEFGVCGAYGGSSERNVFVQIICVVIKLVTGAAGRGVVVIVIIFTAVMFFIGKISWNMMLATALGAGMLFGAPSLVKIFAGKSLVCY